MKNLFLIIIVIQTLLINAQKPRQVPTKPEWKTYLQSRLSVIQTKLYNLSLEGKVKAYCNDSLTRYYSLEYLKYLGSNKYTYLNVIEHDSDPPLKFFSPEDIQCIWFHQRINTSVFGTTQQTILTGIALIYQPSSLGSFRSSYILFNLSINDLKATLTESEFTFITLLYNYSLQSNLLHESGGMEDDDPYYAFNLYPNPYYSGDSVLMWRLSCMLANTSRFINKLFSLYNEEKIIYDHAAGKLISNSEFAANNYFTTHGFKKTGVKDNENVYKDTLLHRPRELDYMGQR